MLEASGGDAAHASRVAAVAHPERLVVKFDPTLAGELPSLPRPIEAPPCDPDHPFGVLFELGSARAVTSSSRRAQACGLACLLVIVSWTLVLGAIVGAVLAWRWLT